MDKLSPEEQIAGLKALTLSTGAIHEVQAHQLRMWPLLIPGINSAEAKVDVDAHSVKFVCEGVKFRKTKKTRKTLSSIRDWVHILLWDDTHVVIEVNGKEVFRSDVDGSEKKNEDGETGGNKT